MFTPASAPTPTLRSTLVDTHSCHNHMRLTGLPHAVANVTAEELKAAIDAIPPTVTFPAHIQVQEIMTAARLQRAMQADLARQRQIMREVEMERIRTAAQPLPVPDIIAQYFTPIPTPAPPCGLASCNVDECRAAKAQVAEEEPELVGV
jgi:hypothetical protein